MSERKELFTYIRKLINAKENPVDIERKVWERFGEQRAVLVMDSSGFTRTTREHGIVYFLSCLVRIRDLVGNIFTKHRCVSCRSEADNMYAEFKTAQNALEATIEANETIRAKKIMLNEKEQFKVCTGIGFGMVLRSKKEGVYGDEMNLASKLGEDIASKGEILLSESAFSEIKETDKERFVKKRITVSGVTLSYYSLNI